MSSATTLDGSLVVAAPTAAGTRVYLVVREGERSRVIDLDDGADVVLGRSSSATVKLEDGKASREHARVVRRGDAVDVTDLGSRNGTVVGGALVQGATRRLRAGELVRIGKAEILLAESAPAAEPPARSDDGGQKRVPAPALPGIVVADAAMVKVFELVRKVAAAPTTVLVLGETGAGKEVIAEQIHRQGKRSDGPFMRLNCGSLPETLIESELFGHEKGAFTGADKRKLGFVEAAHGGTLFLDEIGELALPMQAKLLRVLENHRFTRVGGRDELVADIRIVAATNKDLEDEAKAGRFRQDLYFRLSAFVIRVPALRERAAELELLAELFVRQFARRMNVTPPTIADGAMAALRAHAWPGNVRELRNAIEHAVVLADGGVIGVDALPENVRRGEPAPAPAGPMRTQLADLEKRQIQEALEAEGGNQTRAAKRLGVSRRALQYKMEKYGIKS